MSKKVKKSRLTFLIAVVVLLVLLPIAISLLQNAKKAEAAWMDDNYAYRNRVPISSHTAAESNVYVTVTLDTSASGQFQSDCGDLRFTDVTGNQLPYYIVSGCTTASTVIHVFFKSMPAGAQELYYYYGNPSVANGYTSADFSIQASAYAIGSVGSQEKGGAPVAYWKFDEGTGTSADDQSSNHNNGTITGATWQTDDQCISGKCIYFNGTTAYVSVGDKDLLDFNGTSSFAISVWVKPSTKDATYRRIVSKEFTDGSGRQGWLLWQQNGGIGFERFLNGSRDLALYSNGLSSNSWSHIEAVFDGSTMTLYINGTSVNSVSSTKSLVTNTASFTIGSNPTATASWNGLIDDVKIYNYARTTAQIKSDYASRGVAKGSTARLGSSSRNLDALSNGLVGYWKMDEASWTNDCSTTSVTDSSGNGNNGKACPATTGPTGGAAGKFGNGGFFDGVDDYVNITENDVLDIRTGSMTWTSWFKNSQSARNIIYRKSDSSNANGVLIDINGSATGQIRCYIGQTPQVTVLSAATTYNDGVWHQLSCVLNRTEGTLKLYIDGNQSNSSDATGFGVTDLNAVADATIGQGGGFYFSGNIDDVRIYNRALTPKEVRDLYNWAPGPRVYLKMEEGLGTSANDDSGNGRTGTLNGNPVWSSGKFGKGVKLDGTGDFIQISDF